jgi:hypothetical protein
MVNQDRKTLEAPSRLIWEVATGDQSLEQAKAWGGMIGLAGWQKEIQPFTLL